MRYSEEILARTDGGKAIFLHYFGRSCEKKVFVNPFRHDVSPSCHLYLHRDNNGLGRWYLQDFGDSRWCGDCFSIVARIAGLSVRHQFPEVLKVIDRDLSLGVLQSIGSLPRAIAKERQPVSSTETTSKGSTFTPVYRAFTASELAYWEKYGITKNTLDKFHVEAVESCQFHALGRGGQTKDWTIVSTHLTPCFAYVLNDGAGIKLYRPKSATRFFYGGCLPKPYIFGWEQLPAHGDVLLITGGEKDTMSLAAHGFTAISFNSETASIPDEIIVLLEYRFNHIIFCYDMDETGQRESKARATEFRIDRQVTRIDLPLPGTKQEKDISDFFRLGHQSEELQAIIYKAISNEKQD